MQKVFDNPSQLEALAKQKFGFPDFMVMMYKIKSQIPGIYSLALQELF